KDWLYEVEWQPKTRVGQTLPADYVPGPSQISDRIQPHADQLQNQHGLMPEQGSSWLIFADNKGIGKQLAAQLSSRGETCMMVFPSTSYQQLGEGQYQINPEQAEDFQHLLKAVTTSDSPPCRGVVHLWSLNTVDPGTMTVADLEAASVWGCRSVIHLLQSMVKAEFSNLPSLWLVTQGAKQVSAQPTPLAVAQSPLWGLGKVITLEHPELECVQVDLDPLGQDDQAKALFEELWLDDNEGENNLVLRQGQRYVPRLVRHRQLESSPVELHSDGTYWITGGLGGLGLLVAQWLVAHGARHLVLVGRSGASDQAKVTLKELEQMGAEIVVAQADVSQTEQVRKVLAEIEVSMPPLKGVIHAAGVLKVGLLKQQDWQDFAKVLAPKVQGAWNLHVLTQHIPLDFFILFSSIASLIGSPGQGNHAAGNTFLDTLAKYRQTQGLPALSINWGAWSDVGAVANLNLSQMSSMRGLGTIASQQGLQVLEQIFHNPSAQIGVMPIEWSEFLQQFTADDTPPLFTELKPLATAQEASTQDLEFLKGLEQVLPHERQERLVGHIREQLGKVLGWSSSHTLDPYQGFFDIGIDSLTSLELKNRLQTSLGRSLSSTLIFDYPTIDALAGYLVSEMFTEEEQETDSAETTQKDDHPTETLALVDVEELSEEDAEALLLKKLESISV
ncbi:MAG: SDR family NAD(P)-dependent oxidoreductase, partial [Moorea sp. SIO3C2]|nr:SDR family NAD(P)-dependent oxidoreductase [Moorena sp. SIO3C2]